jgi:hypothetical protein
LKKEKQRFGGATKKRYAIDRQTGRKIERQTEKERERERERE